MPITYFRKSLLALVIASVASPLLAHANTTDLIIKDDLTAIGHKIINILLSGESKYEKVIINSTRAAWGENATVIKLQENPMTSNKSTVHSLTVNGKLEAIGENATGISITGADFTHERDGIVLIQPSIINNGIIKAEHTGIYVNQADNFSLDSFWIENTGTINANTAIDIKNAGQAITGLYFKGGAITGKVKGLDFFRVLNDATYNSISDSDDFDIVMSTDKSAIGFDSAWVDIGNSEKPVNFKLGSNHTRIQGSFNVRGNASLELILDEKTDITRPVLFVSNIVELAKGSTIKLSTQSEDFALGGKRYELIQAEQIQNDGVNIISNSLLMDVTEWQITPKKVYATVKSKSADEVEEVIEDIGGSKNAQRASAAFSEVAERLASESPADPILRAYTAASTDPAALRALVEQFVPEVNGGSTRAALTNIAQVNTATKNRASVLRGASSGDALSDTGFWAQALYSDANQNKRDGIVGFNAYSRGIAFGADGKLNDQLTLGLAYSALHTSVNSKNGNKTDVDGNAITLYTSFEEGNYFVDGNVSYGFNKNKSHRHVAGIRTKGNYDSKTLSADATAGYTYHLNSQFALEPRVTARYARIDIDSFREKGSSAALKTKHQRYEIAELGAGARLVGDFTVGKGTLQPHLTAMAYHDFAADRIKNTSTFVLGSTPFVSQGAKAVRNSYEATVGADYRFGAFTVGADYSYTGQTSYNSDTLSAKVRYDF